MARSSSTPTCTATTDGRQTAGLGGEPTLQAAQDVVHDVFVEVFQKWDDGIAEPRAYLQQAVVNRCRDALRRTTVARRYGRLFRPEDVPAIDAPMYDALATLPFKHRTAVVLRYYLGLTEAEIAACLGCPAGSVGPWIRRGLDRLATQLRLSPEES